MPKPKTTYLLDTNILIESPYAIYAFDEHIVALTDTTLEELDKLKTMPGEKGANVREAIRILNKLRESGSLLEGVNLPLDGGKVKIIVGNNTEVSLPASWDIFKPDNRILNTCSALKHQDENVTLVSNDINMRIKADIIGVPAEGYKTEQMQQVDKQYKGRCELMLKPGIVDKIYQHGSVKYKGVVYGKNKVPELVLNEFLLLRDAANQNQTALGRFDGESIVALTHDNDQPYGVNPRNAGQYFMQEALMMDVNKAPLVIIKGPAGTAKTFYALAAGLQQTVNNGLYNKILVARPNVKFDDDIGFLKGDEKEKIGPLIRPVMDNLSVLTRIKDPGKKDGFNTGDNYAQDLFERNLIEAQALAYMRGRSISNTWVLIDEAQNMSPTQAFGIISRAGIGSKIILAGDPAQIDNPRLDSRTNGLTYAAERMKGSPLCWQITLKDQECVRSPLALEAVNRLSPKGYEATVVTEN